MNGEKPRATCRTPGSELLLLGSVQTEKAGTEGTGGRRRGPLTCFLSPPPQGRLFRGSWGCPLLGVSPPAPSRPARPWAGAVGGAFQTLAFPCYPPSSCSSCSRSPPRPAPPRTTVLLALPSGVRSWCTQHFDHKAKLL